jgi:hypothetical protein
VEGSASGSSSKAVYGIATSTIGDTFGVYGVSSATSSNGTASGVYGQGNTGVAGHGVSTGVFGGCTGSGCNAGYFQGNVTITGALTVGSCSGCSSDRRLKQNIEPLTGAADKLLQLHGVSFDWKNPEEHEDQPGRQVGFIAQDVERIFPQWVGEDKKGFKTLVIPEKAMAALTVESLRSLKAENDALRTQSSDLRHRVEALEAGRRPMVSGFGEGGIGFGLLAVAGAIMTTKRKRNAEQ